MSPSTSHKPPVESLVSLLMQVGQHQDRKAYRQLYEHFAPLIKRFSMAKNSNAASADELVQEVMLKIWMKAASYDASKASPNTWVFTIVRNCRIDLFRQQNRHDRVLDTEDVWEEPESSEPGPISTLESFRTEDAVRKSMTALPAEQREVLNKVFMEGMSHAEAAENLALPLGTVKSRVRLAFKKLQPMLDR